MEEYSENYKKRCIRRLQEWGAPLSGWECVEVSDIAEETDNSGATFTCELCDCAKVRFVHEMRHDDYFEDIRVGCICSGIMGDNILAAQERDRLMKNRAARRKNFLKRTWQTHPNGVRSLEYKNNYIDIVQNIRTSEFYVTCAGDRVNRYKGKPITNFLSAVYAAFNLIDPPVKGGNP